MKTDRNLKEFIEKLKNTAPEIPVDTVKSLIDSGKPSPFVAKRSFQPRRIRQMFNPLKILIMIAPIIIITSALLMWNSPTVKQPEGENLKPLMEQVTKSKNQSEKPNIDRGKVFEQKRPSFKEPLPAEKSLRIPVAEAKSMAQDTVFSGIILDLSKEELARLGFLFDEEGYYYLNKLPDGSKMNFWSHHGKTGGTFGFASGGFVNPSNKSKLNEFDFYPVLTTNLNGEDLYPIDQIKPKVYSDFEVMNDTLVPVLFKFIKLGGYETGDKLIWFKVSDRFFELINSVQSKQCRSVYSQAKVLVNSKLTANRVNYNFPVSPSLENAIRLKPEVLKCMGINYSATAVDVTVRAIEYWFKMQLTIKDGSTSASWAPTIVKPIRSEKDTLLPTVESIILLGISNFGGMKIIDMPTRIYRQLNRKDMTFQQYLNLCIPVLVDADGAKADGQETIFWIYPNERFFNCLPPELAGPIKKEFDYQLYESVVEIEIVPNTRMGAAKSQVSPKANLNTPPEPVPCVYFTNLCESLPGLDYVNLYPNPATDKLNVDLVLQKGKKIQFRVFDLGGRMITNEGSPENYQGGGQYKHQLDISKLQAGLYLLVMTDEEGARLTRRFVKN